jgi:hypothetical protein
MKKRNIISVMLLLTGIMLQAQEIPDFFKSAGSPVNPKVQVAWNRYNSYEGIVKICQEIARAHPQLARVESIGNSYEGRIFS